MSVVTANIKIDGSPVNKEYILLYIDVTKEINRIPYAEIIFLDGEAADKKFAISDSGDVEPGKPVEISLKYEEEGAEEVVFSGLIMKQRVEANAEGSQIVLECKDVAVKLATNRKNKLYIDKTDDVIIKEIIGEYSGTDVPTLKAPDAMTATHTGMVQYYSTDWDFILSRADVNGRLVAIENGEISLIKPEISGEAAIKMSFGEDEVYDFEIEADMHQQYAAVEGNSLDIATQKLTEAVTAADVSLHPGELKPKDLAAKVGGDTLNLIHPVELTTEELQAWADGVLLRSRMATVKGRVKVPGIGSIKLGDVISIQGVSKAFNGDTLVTGVRHQVSPEGWDTDIQFGIAADCFAKTTEHIVDQPAAGLLPAIQGLHIGIVDAFEENEDQALKVKVKVPILGDTDNAVWARLLVLDAGAERGFFFRPEEGDEVLLGFLNDDPRQAFILGSLHSADRAPHLEITADNFEKGFQTKAKHKILFNEDPEALSIKIETPEKVRIELNEGEKFIKIEDDENKNTIVLNADGLVITQDTNTITLNADGISISSGADLKIESSGDLLLSASGKVEISGASVETK